MIDDSVTVIRVAFVFSLFAIMAVLIYFASRSSRRRLTQQSNGDMLGSDVARSDQCAVPDGATATNFQLLSIFPNVAFGIQGLVVAPVLNVISFLLGNVLTSHLIDRFTRAVLNHKTPHAFISNTHGAPMLRKWTACLSLFAFTTVACFEIVYLSRISKSVLGGSDASYYVFVAMLTVSFMLVSVVGGQSAALASDRWLLVIGYVGLHLALGFIVAFTSPAVFDITTFIVFILTAVMLIFRYRQFVAASPRGRARHSIILLSTLYLFGILLYFKFVGVELSKSTVFTAILAIGPIKSGISIKVLALITAASFCAAIFYNFVDFSFWQKYLAEHREGESNEALAERVSSPFWIYVFESPLTWLLPVALGIYSVGLVSESAANQNPINAILDFMISKGLFGNVVAVAFYASLVAIAASTICGYFASTGYLLRKDFNVIEDPSESRLAPGAKHLILIGVAMISVLVPIDMFAKSTDQLITLMLTCFAPLCALTPFVMYPLWFGAVSLNKFGLYGIVSALLIGSIAGFALGFAAAFTNADFNTPLFWAPLPASFVLSWSIYLFSINFGKTRGTVEADN